jgi:transposase
MNNIKHILRLHSQNQTQSEIIVQTGILRKTLKRYLKDFKACGLSFVEMNDLSDKDLDELFAKEEDSLSNEKLETLFSLFPAIDKELRRKGVTVLLLFEKYKAEYPDGVGISQFRWHFSQWKSRVTPTMRMTHKAGDKVFIDFAGEKLTFLDKQTGVKTPVEVFVAILGASQLTYVEAVRSQQKEDFIPACEDALHYFGGVPAAIVPDNLKSAVTKSNKYEPTINQTFADFAEHYNTTILPARARRPQDKALVEGAVRIIYTRIYSKIRDMNFSSLDELNKAILIALEEHNSTVVTGRDYTRREQFEKIEKAALLPLPILRYEFKKQLFATVSRTGYISLPPDKHYYSVPFQYIGKRVKVMFSRYNVEVFHNYDRVALHKRLRIQYEYTTDKEHLPPDHKFVSEWSPESFLKLAEEIHKDVKIYISHILAQKQHPEQAYKSCYGVLNFAKRVGNERLTKACQRANSYGSFNYRAIQKILEKGLDNQKDEEEQQTMPEHDNIRGKEYYK